MLYAKKISVAVVWVLCGVGSLIAQGAEDRFSLKKAVPADVWLYVHTAHNPEREFLEKHWSHVWEAVDNARLDQEFKQLILKKIETVEDQAAFNAQWDKAVELYRGVNWEDMTAHEFVMVSRFEKFPTFLLLFKSKAETVEQNVQGLVRLLEELAGLDESFSLAKSQVGKADLWSVTLSDWPVSIQLFRQGDVIGVATDRSLVEDSVSLLEGRSEKTLVSSNRFQEAIKLLPPAEDVVSFVDMKSLMGGISKLLVKAGDPNPSTAPSSGGSHDGLAFVSKIIEASDFLDYMVATEETSDLKTLQHSIVKLADGGENKPLCRIMMNQKPMDDFAKYVPQDALGYAAWSGLDLAAAYDYILDFIKQKPEGEEALSSWQQIQQGWGFDVRADLLDVVDGRFIAVSFRPAVPTPFASSDGVLMLSVKDPEKAKATLDRLVEKLTQTAEGQQPTVMISPAGEVQADGFRSVMIPALVMLGKINFGIQGEWLIVSNSPSAINKCLTSAEGKSATIVDNDRFKKEGVAPQGRVVYSSFTDLTNSGQELAMALGMMQMTAALLPPEAEEAKPILMMIGKLGPAAAKMNFMSSSSTLCTHENGAWKMEYVTSYKPYVPPSAPVPDASEERKNQEKKGVEGL